MFKLVVGDILIKDTHTPESSSIDTKFEKRSSKAYLLAL